MTLDICHQRASSPAEKSLAIIYHSCTLIHKSHLVSNESVLSYYSPPSHDTLIGLKIFQIVHFSRLTWSVNLNWSDQVPALCTAWRILERRGSWAWRCEWSTAGVCAERAVKCAAGMERGVCRSLSNLAQLCFSALSEPFCLCWTCNAESAPAYYLSPYIKCAGWGWGGSTLGCSPSTNMLLLCDGEAPLLT